jgi:hypothetical protein
MTFWKSGSSLPAPRASRGKIPHRLVLTPSMSGKSDGSGRILHVCVYTFCIHQAIESDAAYSEALYDKCPMSKWKRQERDACNMKVGVSGPR